MASLPRRAQQPRRDAPSSEAESSQSQLLRADSAALSITSEDSQMVLLNSPTRETTEPQPAEPASFQRRAEAQSAQDEVRKCWICFNDETEDTPLSSEWRSPCPCALVAHEACLLDWIADLEAPTSRNRAGGEMEIKCPQCKSDIHLARPRNVVVDAVRGIEKMANAVTIPATLTFLFGMFHSAAFSHGVASIVAIFGSEDAARILAPLTRQAFSPRSALQVLRDHWRLYFGIPLIPPILVLSRTTIAEPALPILPIIFFATTPRSDELLSAEWPPSAALSFSMLPYVRGAYNMYYDLVWRKWEKRWLDEIRPRSTRPENGEEGGERPDDEDDRDIGFGIELDIFEEEWENEPQVHQQAAQAENEPQEGQHQEQPPLGIDQAEGQQGPAENAVPANQAAGNADERNGNVHRHQQRQLDVQLAPFVGSVMGALVFPGIAAVVGEALRFTLPRSLTTPPGRSALWRTSKPTGFLQTRWGRTIVGGCLAVALKDVVMLYVRWKVAVNHRHRRVLNYDRALKRVVHSGL